MKLNRFVRWTESLIPTLKETPQEAQIKSHRLMLRAGLIRKLASGTYSYLPLGLRALKKAEAIVREEMDAAGALGSQPVPLPGQSQRSDLMSMSSTSVNASALKSMPAAVSASAAAKACTPLA